MGTVQELLTKEYLAKLELLNLKISHHVGLGYSGARKSNAKGNSLEFADFRDYTPGDDLRRIDWNSYGRLDKLFMKLFTEEKQATINIFIDKSKSMDYGTVNKFTFAKLAAATIAYLAMKNADRVNVYCCDDQLALRKTNMSTKNVFSELVRFLDSMSPNGKTMLGTAIEETRGTSLGHGASFIISDFFTADNIFAAVKLLQSKKQHVRLIHVLDRSEFEPGLSDAFRVTDAETNDFLDIFVTADVLKTYRTAFTQFQNDLRAFCEKRGADYIFAPTDSNVIKLFLR